MRLLLVAILFAVSAYAAEPFPHWDGAETIEQYAKRANLPPTKTLDLGNGVKLELVLIPAGKFLMGAPEPESPWIGGTILGAAGLLALVLLAVLVARAIRKRRRPQFSLRWLILLVAVLGVAQYGGFRWWWATEARMSYFADDGPAHEVSLSTPHYMGKYEVTQEEYERVMGEDPARFKGARNPVESVSWGDAQEFCRKLSGRTGREVRLPTEAEWERACRAGTKTTYYTGDAETDLDRAGWYDGNSKSATHPVGQKTPNAWGVYDMHGNVWEWCGDWYAEYVKGAQRDPTGEADGVVRVLRGGSWLSSPRYCRSAHRGRGTPDFRVNGHGFRVVVVARTP